MNIHKVHLHGFRNFKDTIVILAEKSLILGSNDIGKTNFLYALRLLLDKNLSEAELEPSDADFFAFEETHSLEILIEFHGIVEDCILAVLKQHISDNGELVLGYQAEKDVVTKHINYQFLAGPSADKLVQIDSRYYLRVLSLKFIASKRDLFAYIRRERRNLLQDAKELRVLGEIDEDKTILVEIEDALEEINAKVRNLSYVNKATDHLNSELSSLSFHNGNQNVVFDVGASDPGRFVDDLRLASQVDGKNVIVGGDGRNNQIYLALWAARNRIQVEGVKDPLEVCIFCIEEPEAHLHPHQQRKLANYLSTTLQGQVILTTHSPQVVCGFPPTSIIRFYKQDPTTLAAGNGNEPFMETAFAEFGYRLNIIPAEAFFADLVLLVEGPSDELFYKALSYALNIDIDRYNISILMVDGVGFRPYVSLLKSLHIPFVMRTDNDVFKIPGQDCYRLAGLQRAVSVYIEFLSKNDVIDDLLSQANKLQGFALPPPKETLELASKLGIELEKLGIFLSDVDLETDLHNSLPDVTANYFGIRPGSEVVEQMQKQKATFMFDFVNSHAAELASLKDKNIAKPIRYCQEIREALYGVD